MEKRKTGLKNQLSAVPFLLPSFIGLIIFSLLPIVISFFLSLTDWNGIDSLNLNVFLKDHFIGFQNYVKILTGGEFFRVLGNTLYFIVLYIPLMLIFSLLIAWLMNKNYKGVSLFRILTYIPVLSSWIAASLIWKWVLAPKFGIANNMLSIFGISGPAWSRVLQLEKNKNALNTPKIRVKRAFILFRKSISTSA